MSAVVAVLLELPPHCGGYGAGQVDPCGSGMGMEDVDEVAEGAKSL